MSYDTTIKGELEFANRDCLVVGIAWFVKFAEMSLIFVRIRGLRVTLDLDASLPASEYSDMVSGLRALGRSANKGRMKTTFKFARTTRETIDHANCMAADMRGLDERLLAIARDWIRNKDPDSADAAIAGVPS